MNFDEIEREAVSGGIKKSWEALMQSQGLEPMDVYKKHNNVWYQTDGIRSSHKMISANDVLPQEILAKNDTPEIRNAISVLMAATTAYNTSEWGSGMKPHKANEFIAQIESIVDLLSDDNKYIAYSRMADVMADQGVSHKNKFNYNVEEKAKGFYQKALDVAPTIFEAYHTTSQYINKFDMRTSLNTLTPESVQMLKKVLTKPKSTNDFPSEFWTHSILAEDARKNLSTFSPNPNDDKYKEVVAHSLKAVELAPNKAQKERVLKSLSNLYYYGKEEDKQKQIEEMLTALSQEPEKIQEPQKQQDPEVKAKIEANKQRMKDNPIRNTITTGVADVDKYVEEVVPYLKEEFGVTPGPRPEEHKKAMNLYNMNKGNQAR